MATNRRRNPSPFTPGTIFGIITTAAGVFCLAIGFGIINPFAG